MKKAALLFLLVSLLSGCAGYAAQYPLCSVLPADWRGAHHPKKEPPVPFCTANDSRTA